MSPVYMQQTIAAEYRQSWVEVGRWPLCRGGNDRTPRVLWPLCRARESATNLRKQKHDRRCALYTTTARWYVRRFFPGVNLLTPALRGETQ